MSDLAVRARWLGAQVVALLAGILSGSLTAATYVRLELIGVQWPGAFVLSLVYGTVIAAFCVPVWVLLARMKCNIAPAAGLLGLGATQAFGLTFWDPALVPIAEKLLDDLPITLCGAFAGLVTYFVGRVTTARALRQPAGIASHP